MSNLGTIERAFGGTLVAIHEEEFGCSHGLMDDERRVMRWVDLQARKRSSTDGIYLLAKKVMRAMCMERSTSIPALLVVRFEDGVYTAYFRRFEESPVLVRMGLEEPMWHLSVEKMQRLEVKVEVEVKKPHGGEPKEREQPWQY